MAPSFRRSSKGVAEILRRPETAAAINDLAEQIHAAVVDEVGDAGIDVEMEPYTTDRAAAAVTITDPRGLWLQATQGTLTRAAARFGLDIAAR